MSVKSSSVPDTDTQVEFHLFDCGGQSIFNQREWGTKYVRADQPIARLSLLLLSNYLAVH